MGGRAGYAHRGKIRSGVLYVKATGSHAHANAHKYVYLLLRQIVDAATRADDAAKAKASSARDAVATGLGQLHAKATRALAGSTARKTAASAAGGAVVGGTAGGACGTVAGGAFGAAVGVVPALFTFGLSIPVCAIIGGGTGLAAGTALGSSAGAVGGAAAYGGYHNRAKIRAKLGESLDLHGNPLRLCFGVAAAPPILSSSHRDPYDSGNAATRTPPTKEVAEIEMSRRKSISCMDHVFRQGGGLA